MIDFDRCCPARALRAWLLACWREHPLPTPPPRSVPFFPPSDQAKTIAAPVSREIQKVAFNLPVYTILYPCLYRDVCVSCPQFLQLLPITILVVIKSHINPLALLSPSPPRVCSRYSPAKVMLSFCCVVCDAIFGNHGLARSGPLSVRLVLFANLTSRFFSFLTSNKRSPFIIINNDNKQPRHIHRQRNRCVCVCVCVCVCSFPPNSRIRPPAPLT